MDKKDIEENENNVSSDYDIFNKFIADNFFIYIDGQSEKTRSQTRRAIKKYTLQKMIDAAEIIADKEYENSDSLNKYDFIQQIRTYCYWKVKELEDPKIGSKYIAGILFNRFGQFHKSAYYDAILGIFKSIEYTEKSYSLMKKNASELEKLDDFLHEYGLQKRGENG